ncbi:MAG: hypothetical protein ABIS47_03585 [Acidimicrobiales bacterium]
MKKALIVVLVVLVVVTGVPFLMGPGVGVCADCSTGVMAAATTCVAVLPIFLTLPMATALVLLAAWAAHASTGRVGSRPPVRPPQLV